MQKAMPWILEPGKRWCNLSEKGPWPLSSEETDDEDVPVGQWNVLEKDSNTIYVTTTRNSLPLDSSSLIYQNEAKMFEKLLQGSNALHV